MEAEKQKQKQHKQPFPSPSPNPPSSLLLKDISNFKTPKQHHHHHHRPQNPNFHSPFPKFFTASKDTPRSSSSSFRRRRPSLTSAQHSKVARRLKAFELEQSKSARKAQINKEKSLKSLSKSLTVWLNFLFQNPRSCGCDLSKLTGEDWCGESEETVLLANGKRESGTRGVRVGVDREWRSPKRQRDSWWRGGSEPDVQQTLPNSMFSGLKSSLSEVCSFDDLQHRMRVYLSLGSCKEIFNVMTQVTKNIDEGRIKMKAHCPIVSDVGMKEKGLKILMCYNPIWLRIALYIVLGGDSLLPNENANSEQELAFLSMVVEKQFLSHAGLAKAYAYNKLVEGLYRPGYFEALGKIILKRIFLLVLILDRAKSQSSLPNKYGIDGLDGGSPLLFTIQSQIKSSRQVIHDFLSSDVMHGEGNLVAHLAIIGYKVTYQQGHLIEYDFRVTDLFADLQDGVRLCRAIQLLQHDSSILTKMVVPSDTRKKNLVNCGVALQHLTQAGVSLHDEEGAEIIGEDVVNGDKELTLSLLWNMFVHLQLPLLVNRRLLSEEISKIRGVGTEHLNTSPLLDMLLNWIQAISESYSLRIDNFASLIDGKAMWCLLDYYFRKELHCSCASEDLNALNGESSIMSATDYTDAVHNFILSQKLTTLLGNFPEVMQVSDILESNGACNDRSVVILLVFLSFQLIVKKNMVQLNFHKLLGFGCHSPERKRLSTERCFMHSEPLVNQEEVHGDSSEDALRNFKDIMDWWSDMAQRNKKYDFKPATPPFKCFLTGKKSYDIQKENAAIIMQSHIRRSVESRNYLRIKRAVSFLQTVIRAWLTVKKKSAIKRSITSNVQEAQFERSTQSELFGRYMTFMVDRHAFVKLRKSVAIIQRAWKRFVVYSYRVAQKENASLTTFSAIIIQSHLRGWIARRRAYRQRCLIIALQSHCRGWLTRRELFFQMVAVKRIQSAFRCGRRLKVFHQYRHAAIEIQRFVRGQIARNQLLGASCLHEAVPVDCNFETSRGCFQSLELKIFLRSVVKLQRWWRDVLLLKSKTKSAVIIQSYLRGWIVRQRAKRMGHDIVVIQSHYRGWLTRRELLFQKKAVTRIQSAFQCVRCSKLFNQYRHAAIEIQRFVRGQITRNRLLGASCLHEAVPVDCNFEPSSGCFQSLELKIFLRSVVKLQRWWRDVLLLKSKTKSVIIIQSYVRRWIFRQRAERKRHHIVVIQSYWRGYHARKDSTAQLLNLRLRMQKSSTNVDDGMRIINRLVAALSELLSMKSVSAIRHTCATLDMATKYSQKCCEELVAVGAVDILVKLIRSVSRSIPDQEVLKHALSTLKNLTRHSHLTDVLIDSRGCIETILWEFLRNKEEGYFIASAILNKICLYQKGVESVRNFPPLVKRLHNLVDELTRKIGNEKRNARGLVGREQTERRLREVVELMKLISKS